MRKYWIVFGLAVVVFMSCGEKGPSPAPPAPPSPAPEAASQDQQSAPADTVKPAETSEAPSGTMVKSSDRVDPSRMPRGPYTIQVAAWETREDASKLADFFQGKGYEARVEPADVRGDRWYRVRIGEYGNFSQAQDTALKIQEQYKSEIWLVKL